MRRRSSLLAVLLAALALPAAAGAADAPRMTLGAERVGHGRAVLAGASWRVRGVVQPYVAGQQAVVRFYRRGRKIVARRVTLRRSPTGASGFFVVAFRARTAGDVVVAASHRATPELPTVRSRPVTVEVLPRRASPGARGPAVALLQRRLARLGYVVGQRGLFDARTARAVLAFRKVVGMARTSEAGEAVFRALARGRGQFRVRFPGHGRHVEADLSRQVLALVDGDTVERVYPASSGAPVTPTVRGSFRVYLKTPGTNQKGMVHSTYFIRGFAIHGYWSVPPWPASHGCLRVPVPEALSIFRWLRYGDRVDVYV